MCSAQLLFKPGKKDNEEGREERRRCGAVGGGESSPVTLVSSGSLNTHTHTLTGGRWSVCPLLLLSARPAATEYVGQGGQVRTRMPSRWSQGWLLLLLLPGYLLSFVPPPPDVSPPDGSSSLCC